ncbi:MAG: DEAD/DEAH box helicase [Candidatus Magasanikbacteria bacterium]|nr:DEAD/DEAH box helicase [Candidatus Magasanikbacteria bacterium]
MTQTLHPSPAVPRFSDLGIAPKLLAVLEQNKFTDPTPIQHQAIPPALEGKDLVGIAQTGTGKTLAFGIPMIQRLASTRGQGLILLPTRELALQVEETLQKVGRVIGLKSAVLIGGASMYQQIQQLRRTPHIIVATPGRLVDHLQQKTISLNNIKIVVLDEADRMLDIGFLPQIKQILSLVPTDRQTMLFSATMPSEIAQLAGKYMRMPLRVEVAPSGTTIAKVEQEVFMVSKEVKMQLLDKLLTDNPGTILLFSRTKHGAKKIAVGIRHMGHTAVEIHSNRSLAQRKEALAGFKSGKYRIMVATDIAARGIDVKDISIVINYDLPDAHEDYVHRIGRTGRAGSMGKAISFASPDQRADLKGIERLIRKTLPILALPVLPPRRAPVFVPRDNFNSFAPRQQGGAQRSGGQGFGGRSSGGRPPQRSSGGGGNFRRRFN